MPKDIEIRQLGVAERDDLLVFLHAAYPDEPRKRDPEFWTWHFPENPYARPNDLPVWVATSGGRIVGQLATIPVEINIRGESVPAIWILDLIVDPQFRRRGIMKNLVLEAEKSYPFMLGVSTSAQHSPAMLKGLGWGNFTEIPRYHKLLFPGDALPQTPGFRSLRSTINLAFAAFRPNLKGIEHENENVAVVEDFDSSFDTFWDEVRVQWDCSISRPAASLKWQFCRQPNKKFDIITYRENGKLLGYAVLFFRKATAAGSIPKAAISDICYHPENPRKIVDALLRAALALAVERRAGGLVADALDPLLEERLRHSGFWRVKSGLIFMANGPREREVLYDPKNWLLTRGDSDISIFEEPNL